MDNARLNEKVLRILDKPNVDINELNNIFIENPSYRIISLKYTKNIDNFIRNIPHLFTLIVGKDIDRLKIFYQEINLKKIDNLIKLIIEFSNIERTSPHTNIRPKITNYKPRYHKYKIFPYRYDIDLTRLLISDIGLYSISRSRDAYNTTQIILSYLDTRMGNRLIITDATGGVGGDAICFAKYFNKVNIVELSGIHCKIIKNNLRVYDLLNKTNIICTNYLNVMYLLNQDVIFFDPPWGGPNYKKQKMKSLFLSGIDIEVIVNKLLINKRTKLIAIKIPHNFNFVSFKRNVNHKYIRIHRFRKYNLLIAN